MSDVTLEELNPDERATAHPSPRTWERPKLTERRKQILKFCHKYSECKGWAASHEEIAEHCATDYQAVVRDLEALALRGSIEYEGSRQIKVLELP